MPNRAGCHDPAIMGFTLWGDYDANLQTAHSKYKRYMNVAGTGHDYYGPECAAPVNPARKLRPERTDSIYGDSEEVLQSNSLQVWRRKLNCAGMRGVR